MRQQNVTQWDSAGLPWTGSRNPRRADLGDWVCTDAGRTERGLDAVRNGECTGRWVFRWVGIGGLSNRRLSLNARSLRGCGCLAGGGFVLVVGLPSGCAWGGDGDGAVDALW